MNINRGLTALELRDFRDEYSTLHRYINERYDDLVARNQQVSDLTERQDNVEIPGLCHYNIKLRETIAFVQLEVELCNPTGGYVARGTLSVPRVNGRIIRNRVEVQAINGPSSENSPVLRQMFEHFLNDHIWG